MQQKQQILTILTDSSNPTPLPQQPYDPLQVEIAANGEIHSQQQQQRQLHAGRGESAVQLVDMDHLLSFIPVDELINLQSTIHSLLSTHGVDGTVYVTLSRINPAVDPAFQSHQSSPRHLTQNDLIVAAADLQPAGTHDVVSSQSDSSPHTVAGVAPTTAPAAPFTPRFPLMLPSNESYPNLLLPPPTLPPYSPSTPASTYRPYLRTEFLHAYHAYCRDAWGLDDYMPVTRRGSVSYGMSLTMVDALDTLILMEEWGEAERAVQWMADHLRFGHQQDINVFETTIRILGSLLSSAHLINTTTTLDLPPTTRDALSTILLTHAHTLGTHLLHAFQTPLGIPYGTLSLQTRTMYNPGWSGGSSTMAELGSVQLEFQYLTRVTGKEEYEEAVDGVMWAVRRMNRSLYGQFMSVDKGEMTSNVLTLGARVDSLYEYFLKVSQHTHTQHARTSSTPRSTLPLDLTHYGTIERSPGMSSLAPSTCFNKDLELLLANGRSRAAGDIQPNDWLLDECGQPVQAAGVQRAYQLIPPPAGQAGPPLLIPNPLHPHLLPQDMFQFELVDYNLDPGSETTHPPLIVTADHIMELICHQTISVVRNTAHLRVRCTVVWAAPPRPPPAAGVPQYHTARALLATMNDMPAGQRPAVRARRARRGQPAYQRKPPYQPKLIFLSSLACLARACRYPRVALTSPSKLGGRPRPDLRSCSAQIP